MCSRKLGLEFVFFGTLTVTLMYYTCYPKCISISYDDLLKKEKAKFKLTLRKFLNTHSFYSVDEFFMCEDDL
jgi:hypothetical protein